MWNWDTDTKVIRDWRSWYSHHNIPPCLLKTWPQSAGASVPWLVRVVPWLVVWPLVCNIAISCADYRNISISAASHHADICIFNLTMRGGEDVFLTHTHPLTLTTKPFILVILCHNLRDKKGWTQRVGLANTSDLATDARCGRPHLFFSQSSHKATHLALTRQPKSKM